MVDPFVGSIQYFAFSYAPQGWAQCNGQAMNINQYQAAFALLSTVYGGDGRTTFCLPDYRGRSIIGQTTGMNMPAGVSTYAMGAKGGAETAVVPAAVLPVHNHPVMMKIAANSSPGAVQSPLGAYPATTHTGSLYSTVANGNLGGEQATVSPAGASAPFSTLPPYIALNCCIALAGIYPPRP